MQSYLSCQDTLLRTPPGPPAQVLTEGTVLAGRFELRRFIARGGMGVVYEAEDRMLRARVAVKVLLGALPDAQERIRREVLLARAVAHPNVCRVYELFAHAGEQGELLFLVMELLDGETLTAAIGRRGRFLPDEAEPLLGQMAAALGAAHAHGVLHRDFKSSNVLLVRRPDGSTRVVVTDFGVARAVRDGQRVLTCTGSYVGTPAYMAPEQASGSPLGPAADVYALGVVAYEMLTGELPFADTPLGPGAARARTSPPDLDQRTPDLPERWRRALTRALAPSVDDRCPTPDDFVRLLEGQRVRTAGMRRRVRRALGLAAGCVLALAFGGSTAGVVRHHLFSRSSLAASTPSTWAPADPSAARIWRTALQKLDAADNMGAAAAFRQVTALAPEFVLARTELAHALDRAGFSAEARDTARFAFEAAGRLPEQQRMAVEAEHRALSGEQERAAGLWGTLFDLYPTDVRLGVRLASVQTGDARRATLVRLQRLPTTPLEATAVDWVAYAIAFDDGQLALADAALARVADRARALGLPTLEAAAAFERAAVALEREDTDAADRLHADAMRAGAGSEWAWRAAKDRAITLRYDRPLREVSAWLQQAVDGARKAGDARLLADVLWDMSPLQLSRGNVTEAEAAAQEAEALDRPRPPEARSRGALSRMYQWREQSRIRFARGALVDAARLAEQAQEENVRVEDKGFRVLPYLAEILRAQGKSQRAADLLAGAINEKGLPTFIQGRVLVQRANVLLDLGRVTEARKLFEAARPAHRTRYDEAFAALVQARLLRHEGRPSAARLEALRASNVAESNGFFEPALLAQLELARDELALGVDPRPRVLTTRDRAATAGVVPLRLEAELALGEVLARKPGGASRALAELQREAQARGFLRIATSARQLSQQAVAPRNPAGLSALTRR
ncbi:MAG TPA: protein kinase [Myxococcaceae bacterium]|jgi:tetratricopeptide (TPR) repeat protein